MNPDKGFHPRHLYHIHEHLETAPIEYEFFPIWHCENPFRYNLEMNQYMQDRARECSQTR